MSPVLLQAPLFVELRSAEGLILVPLFVATFLFGGAGLFWLLGQASHPWHHPLALLTAALLAADVALVLEERIWLPLAAIGAAAVVIGHGWLMGRLTPVRFTDQFRRRPTPRR